jgi:multidrug resistance efflux pump
VKRAAVAPFDGFIATAPVRPGDVVKEGALLGSLDDRELVLDRVRWESKLAQNETEYRQALAERDAAKVEILAASIQEARTELGLINDRLGRTELRAPFDGVVVTGDLTQRLGAPVKRGEVLFEVAPFDAYRVHLQVKERDVGEVEIGDRGHLLLSSAPSEPVAMTVDKITPVATAEEGKNTFQVEGHLDAASERLRPGLEGIAKVDVGERRLIWIWIHELIDWVRLKIWTWTP